MTEAPEPQLEAAVEEAKRQGFLKGLNLGLLAAAIPSALIGAGWSIYDSPRYESVFRQIKVPMPGLTLLVLNNYPFVAAVLILGVIGSGIATLVWGHQRRTVYLNAALLIASILWLAVFTTAYHLPFMFVLESIGQPHRTP